MSKIARDTAAVVTAFASVDAPCASRVKMLQVLLVIAA